MFVFFVFFKKTPFVLPQTKVKSCRAYVFTSSIFSINEKPSFLSRRLLLFYFVCFFWKNGNTKNPKKNIVLFSF